jgi:hypothetical protein
MTGPIALVLTVGSAVVLFAVVRIVTANERIAPPPLPAPTVYSPRCWCCQAPAVGAVWRTDDDGTRRRLRYCAVHRATTQWESHLRSHGPIVDTRGMDNPFTAHSEGDQR